MDTEHNMKQNSDFLENYVVGRPKTSFSARFCAYFQILRSLPDSAKNSAGAESQNPGGTGQCICDYGDRSKGKVLFLSMSIIAYFYRCFYEYNLSYSTGPVYQEFVHSLCHVFWAPSSNLAF